MVRLAQLPLVFLGTALAGGVQSNPLGKVLDLIDELVVKISKDGEREAKAYGEYFEWCDDTSKNAGFAIQTGEKQKDKLEATIGELSSDIAVGTSKIEELAGAVSTAQAELGDAKAIREKEVAEFSTSEAELVDAIETLGRAIGILEKDMAKNPASLAQLNAKSISGALQGLSEVLNAAAFFGKDQVKLAALVQSRQTQEVDDLEPGAPAAAQYKTHSTSILDVLEDLKEKAEGQLSDLRKAETNTKHNYEMLQQSLVDQSAADTKDMEEQKAGKAANEEAKAAAESDLQMTVRALGSSRGQLATAHATCLQVAADHEATVAARTEELSTIAQARKVLLQSTSGASSQTYSFLQAEAGSLSGLRLRTRSDLAGSEVVMAVKRLAKQQHSAALAQLASRIATVLRYSTSAGEDPFGKVKGLIQDMIAKLEKEAGNEATEKAYCDEQMAKTEAKKSELEDDVSRMTTRIDRAAATSAQLKEETRLLQSELSTLAKEQAEMDGIRRETRADFVTAKADLEEGLSGIRQALDTLRNYYGAGAASMLQDDKFGAFMQQPAAPEKHSKSSGAGGGIIDILSVVESDFASNLAKEELEEADAQSEYDKVSQENEVTKTIKEQGVKYKTQGAKAMDATVAEYSADRETASAELSAVNEYYSRIKDRCIAKPETYEARKARRVAEINGLKEALSILENETALMQRRKRGGHFRGSLAAL